ncbi:DNA-protecting protein DprA [Alteromonas sediminis]|uniref:DNA-protecting protein DprA n=1 Tax=Alteromonas sediminis TaxID=2259342 RepID=A0A3N5Y0X6_9ALTE|nr:DNA-processing protein DprA [Alteromonas sediminis]RPJ66800.1 DNA-protecting protein DprA [Alteromonas sediminis]
MQKEEQTLAWLLASKLTALKAPEWKQLCESVGKPMGKLFLTSEAAWQEYGLPPALLAKMRDVSNHCETVLNKTQRNGIQCITFDDPLYPIHLKQLACPPCVLFVLGDAEKLQTTQMSIVGSRHASQNGCRIASQIAEELSDNAIIVTSGLARGIDAAAHEGAFYNGNTLAVLGTGVDVCYPKYNRPLYNRILENGGAVVSEFFPGTPPRAHHFPCRNRIVAGLSKGVLVIEAKIRSGSLITANLAADMGKDVFAVPGNINNPLSEGVNWLIQQGAKLVTQTSDIIEELGFFEEVPIAPKKTVQKHLASDPILDSVDYDVTSVDDITKRSKLPIQELMAALLEYELRGIVAAVPGGYIKLRGK